MTTYVSLGVLTTNEGVQLSRNHRLKLYEESGSEVVLGYDPTYYGPKTMEVYGEDRFIVSKREFLETCITMVEFNLRWLNSLRESEDDCCTK